MLSPEMSIAEEEIRVRVQMERGAVRRSHEGHSDERTVSQKEGRWRSKQRKGKLYFGHVWIKDGKKGVCEMLFIYLFIFDSKIHAASLW